MVESAATPLCDNCGKRPGTEPWVGDGGLLAMTHGWTKMWCKPCVLEAQIGHARERADVIPELEAELAAALKDQDACH